MCARKEGKEAMAARRALECELEDAQVTTKGSHRIPTCKQCWEVDTILITILKAKKLRLGEECIRAESISILPCTL